MLTRGLLMFIMTQEDFENFRQIVLRDLSLQARLRSVTERSLCIQKIIEAGAENGFEITREDIEEALYQSRREWREKWI